MKVTENTLSRRLDNLEMPGRDAGIVERIRYLIVLLRLTQAQFGERINIDPSNMSKLLSGRLRVTDRVINRIVVNLGVSKEWLTDGSDVPFPRAHAVPAAVPDYGTRVDNSSDGAPVYDIDVTAGCQELSRMFTNDRIIGYMKMPSISDKYPLVRVSGDSMAPRIGNGSFVQIRPINPDSPIFWGATYVVVTDDYRMVKVVRRHPDTAKVILHSINPDYDDMEIPRDAIRFLYIVEAVLNYDIIS